MAAFETYTGDENPGQWYGFGIRDRERNVDVLLRIKAVTRELRERLDKEFGKPERVGGGVKFRRIPDKLSEKANVVQAARVWTDAKNLWIRVKTQEALELYRKELSLDGDLAVGDEVCLDGKLTDALKRDLLDQNMALTLGILGKAQLLEEQAQQEEQELEKN